LRKISQICSLLILGVLLLSAGFSFAVTGEVESAWSNVDVSLRLGYKNSLWDPGFRTDVLKFETEGLESVELGILLQFRKIPLAFYRYEGPMAANPNQDELFEKNVEQDAALKEIQLGFLFSWVAALTSSDSSFVLALSRLRYVHTEQTFFGNVVANERFAYVPIGTEIEVFEDFTRFYGIETIEEGESVAFRTEFVDDEVSVHWPLQLWGIPFHLRAGAYQSKWLRPSDLDRDWRLVEDDTLMIYETEFKSQGIVLGVEPLTRDIAGPNLALTGHWGLNDDVSNRVNRDYEIEEGEELQYASGVIDWWFNWFPKSDRVMLTAGAQWDRRVFATKISPFDGTWEDDDLYRFYAMLRVAL
jgi:hypothetical protein